MLFPDDVTLNVVRSLAVGTAMCLTAAAAAAQEHNTFAVGANVTRRMAPDATAQGHDGFGIKWRLGHDDTGWGWHYGLSWYETSLDRNVGGRTLRFGELKVRPFLGGYGYTHRYTKRLSITGAVLGGVAFSSIELTPQADAALHTPSGQTVRVLTAMTPVVKPEISAWYDLTKRFGVSVDAGYILARPRLTIATATGRDTGRIRADAFTIGTGLVYRIF